MLNPFEEIKPASTIEEMRAEIFRLTRFDALVRASMDAADYKGLSAEDKYTLLSYHLLKSRYELQVNVYNLLSTRKPEGLLLKDA